VAADNARLDAVADAMLVAATAPPDTTGSTWAVQHGKLAWAVQFPDIPGPDGRLNVPVRSKGISSPA
jgi:hypothetical protein